MRAEAEGPDLDLLFSIAGRFGRSLAPILQSVSRPVLVLLPLFSVFLFDDSPAGASERSTHTKAVRKGGVRRKRFFLLYAAATPLLWCSLGEEGTLT